MGNIEKDSFPGIGLEGKWYHVEWNISPCRRTR